MALRAAATLAASAHASLISGPHLLVQHSGLCGSSKAGIPAASAAGMPRWLSLPWRRGPGDLHHGLNAGVSSRALHVPAQQQRRVGRMRKRRRGGVRSLTPTGNMMARMARDRQKRLTASAQIGIVAVPSHDLAGGERKFGEGWFKNPLDLVEKLKSFPDEKSSPDDQDGNRKLRRRGGVHSLTPTGNMMARMARDRQKRLTASAQIGIVAVPSHDLAGGERKFGEGWFKNPLDLVEKLKSFPDEKSSPDDQDGNRKFGEGWIKSSDEIENFTLKGFRQLFERVDANKKKKLGPLWHLHQLFLACLPSCFIVIGCSFVTGTDREIDEITHQDMRVYRRLKMIEGKLKEKEPEEHEKESEGAHDTPPGKDSVKASGKLAGRERTKEEEELFYEFLRWKEQQAQQGPRSAQERP